MCEVQFLYNPNGFLSNNDKQQMSIMLENGSDRNSHGFGVFDEKCNIIKKAEKFEMKYSNDIIKGVIAKPRFLVGHTRFATSGEHIDINTHPFEVGDWLYVHNGVISNHKEIRENFKIETDVECDSIVFGHLMNMMWNGDIIQTIKNACAEMYGSFSIMLFHKKTKKMYYIRHSAIFNFALIKMPNNRIRIAGSTNEETLHDIYRSEEYGFDINKNEVFIVEPYEDTIYEIDKNGLNIIGDFEAKKWANWSNTNTKKENKDKPRNDTFEDVEITTFQQFCATNNIDIQIKKCNRTMAKIVGLDAEEFIKDNLKHFHNTDKGTIWVKDLKNLAVKIYYDVESEWSNDEMTEEEQEEREFTNRNFRYYVDDCDFTAVDN